MVPLLLSCRLLLCGVFLIAGLSKLKDRAGSRQSLIDFGLPELLARPFALLLPIAEVAVAIGLLPASFAWISATATLALLILFILAIAVALARGRKPDCHCFGQIHSEPIGWGLAGRDAALAAVAAVIIYDGPRQPSFLTWISASVPFFGGPVFFGIFLIVLAVLILQSLAIFQLMQQGGRVLLRLDALEKGIGNKEQPPPQGLPIGDPAPEFELPDLEGASVSLRQLVSGGKPVLMLFINPGCRPCTALLSEAAAWQRDAATQFKLAVISQRTADENRANAEKHAIQTFLLQRDQETSGQYAAPGTPSAVLVRADGVIGSAVATGSEAIRSLVSSVINESVITASVVAPNALPLQEGIIVPPLVFPDLDGRMFNLLQLRGKPAILLFWNPNCSFCQRMSNDLKTWEKKFASAGMQLVLISTGTVEANRKQSFRSPILLDQNFKAGKVFGATGTPSALSLDDHARIFSKVATGKQDILDSVFNAVFRP